MSEATIDRQAFGEADGQAIDLYVLKNGPLLAKVMTYGALLTELHVPDRAGRSANVVLGFDKLRQYLEPHPYFGATIGRFGNRIAGGQFTLGGRTFTLAKNNGANHLHGGIKGFDKVVWKARSGVGNVGPFVTMTHHSADGDEGYPGALDVAVTYTLESGALRIEYRAEASVAATPVNLTNHSYFNLRGAGRGDVLRHEVTLNAARYTPVNEALIPTGMIAPVAGTSLDFTAPRVIGAGFAEMAGEPGGYDHNFVLNQSAPGQMTLAARVREPETGRVMEVLTTEPGVQFYTGNFLDGTISGSGGVYAKHAGFCLETQHFPDSVNRPEFPTTILRPGQMFQSATLHRFSAV